MPGMESIKVAEKMFRFKERYGWRLVPHSVDEVEIASTSPEEAGKSELKGGTHIFDDSLLTPAMRRFIQKSRIAWRRSSLRILPHPLLLDNGNRHSTFHF